MQLARRRRKLSPPQVFQNIQKKITTNKQFSSATHSSPCFLLLRAYMSCGTQTNIWFLSKRTHGGARSSVRKHAHARGSHFFLWRAFPYMNPGQALSIGYSREIRRYSKLKKAGRGREKVWDGEEGGGEGERGGGGGWGCVGERARKERARERDGARMSSASMQTVLPAHQSFERLSPLFLPPSLHVRPTHHLHLHLHRRRRRRYQHSSLPSGHTAGEETNEPTME